MTNGGGDRLWRRRCIGFRVAFVLGILLAVINRHDTLLLLIALGGIAIVAIAYWRDCRSPRRSP
jgi:hypothetical protein